jgi:hypothetical protein
VKDQVISRKRIDLYVNGDEYHFGIEMAAAGLNLERTEAYHAPIKGKHAFFDLFTAIPHDNWSDPWKEVVSQKYMIEDCAACGTGIKLAAINSAEETTEDLYSQLINFIDDLEDEGDISNKEGVALRKLAMAHSCNIITIYKAAQKAKGSAVKKRFIRSARELLKDN